MSRQKPAQIVLVLKLAAVLGAVTLAACSQEPESPPPQPYLGEYPAMAYGTTEPQGRVGQLARAVNSGSESLQAETIAGRGYLDALLDSLEIDVSSQALVFSRTSLQTRLIRPETPRAIYFNDDTYVAFIPGAPTLEIASFDPQLGPVFYTLRQDSTSVQQDSNAALMERQFNSCLRCHDSYSLSGGGVPRLLLGSGYTGTDGNLVSHEAWILTSPATPLRSRWGGWYVSGFHGEQVHLGNVVVQQAADLQDLESLRVGNLGELSGLLDLSAYPSAYSDIVALMVLEHQVEVQNLISRLRFEASRLEAPVAQAEAASGAEGSAASVANNAIVVLADHIDALVAAMTMQDEIELNAAVRGTSGFAEHFESLGPFDNQGRSLRQLNLQTRLFEYPLSYQIYSEGFQSLPDPVRAAVYSQLRLALADETAVTGILRDTLPAALSAGND